MKDFWKYLVIFLLGGLVGFFIGTSVGNVIAKDNDKPEKVYVCHCEPQKKCETLHIAEEATKRHLKEHKDDYRGQCEEPTPTPTPEPKEYPVCHCEYQETLLPVPNGELNCETLWGTENFVTRHLRSHKDDYKGECREPEPTPTPVPDKPSVSIERPGLQCGTNYVTWTGKYFYPWKGKHYVKFIINGREPEVKYDDGVWSTGELTLAPKDYKIRAELWGYWKEEWHLKASQDGKFTIDECPPEPTPTPIPEPEPEERGTTPAGAPVCSDGVPLKVPTNPHVVRNGSEATINAHVSNGNHVNIYFRENDAEGWVHADRDVPVVGGYISHVIRDLDPNTGYTFGIQAANNCAGGETVLAVVVDPPAFGVTFPFSYWEWLK